MGSRLRGLGWCLGTRRAAIWGVGWVSGLDFRHKSGCLRREGGFLPCILAQCTHGVGCVDSQCTHGVGLHGVGCCCVVGLHLRCERLPRPLRSQRPLHAHVASRPWLRLRPTPDPRTPNPEPAALAWQAPDGRKCPSARGLGFHAVAYVTAYGRDGSRDCHWMCECWR